MLSAELLSKARQLPSGLLGMRDYIQEKAPTTVLACDCDGRPIGRALEALARASGIALASADESIHYARVNRRLDPKVLSDHLSAFFEQTVSLAAGSRPSIVVVDDHISKGTTRRTFGQALQHFGMQADISWITYTGRGADYNCRPYAGPGALMPWRDRPEVIGITYDATLKPVDAPTPDSIRFYEAIEEGAFDAIGGTNTLNDRPEPVI